MDVWDAARFPDAGTAVDDFRRSIVLLKIRRPLQRSSVPDLLDRPRSLEDEPAGNKGFR